MAYDSSQIDAFKNVWVFCEQRQSKMMPKIGRAHI